MTETTGVRPEILEYYARGAEDGRLRAGHGRLEFWRTQDIVRRLVAEHAPGSARRVLDVGGGSGVHAAWLAGDGHRVELIDPVPLHVEQASAIDGVTARIGDARALEAEDASADVVLLLGPLYHLVEAEDRLLALGEARRVLKPGGLLVAATINRYAPVLDNLRTGHYFEDGHHVRVDEITASGRNDARAGFTTAIFQDPEDALAEVVAAGLGVVGQFGVEGAGWLYGPIEDWLDDEERRALVLSAMRQMESVPTLLGASGHLLTAALKN